MKKLIIVLIPLFLLTGCWNYRELNQMAIVSAIAVEKEGEYFKMTAQIMNAKKTDTQNATAAGGSSSPVTVLIAKGKTMHEALRNMVLISPRKLYIGHTELFVIDEKVAYNGIMDIVDFMIRDPESRKQFQVVVSKEDSASDILTVLTPLEALPTQDILSTLKVAAEHKGIITEISYDELLSYIYDQGIENVLPVISVSGSVSSGQETTNTQKSVPKSNIQLDGLSIFKGDRMLGFLSKDDSLGFNLIRNNITYDVISYKCDQNNYASMEIVRINSSFKVEIKNNKPYVKIKTTGTGVLSEMNCKMDITTEEARKEIKKQIDNKIKELMANSIKHVQQQYDSDIFGFGNYLYHNNYSYWKENKNNWDSLFANLDYEINVDLKLTKKGSILDSAKEG